MVAIWAFIGGTGIYLYLIEYHHLALFTMSEAIFAGWLVAIFAAIVFPYRRPEMYAGSPVSGLRVFGLPAMSVVGAVAFVFFGFLEFRLWKDPIVAGPIIKSPLPLEFWILSGTIVLGALWYARVKAYRRRGGVDIRLAFQQIPIE